MRYSALTSILMAGAAAWQVAGSVIEARSSLEFIFRRQTSESDICTPECSTFQNSLDVCETASCLCTRTVANGLNTCVNCFYRESPTTAVLTEANNLIEKYEEGCAGITGLPTVSVTTGSGGASTAFDLDSSTTARVVPTTTPPNIISTPTSRTIVRAAATTSDTAATTTIDTPSGSSGQTGRGGRRGKGGLSGLGSGAQSLSFSARATVIALAIGASFAL